MIINIRGTNGSGKSTVVRALMQMSDPPACPVYGLLGMRRPAAYALSLPGVRGPVWVLGPYDIPTGGCDSLRSAQILALLRRYADEGHIVFEGSLVSDHWGEVGEFLYSRAADTVVAFMPASLEECLRRVEGRRAAAGNFAEFGPARTEKRYRAIECTRRNFVEGRVRAVTLSDDRAAYEVLDLLRGVT